MPAPRKPSNVLALAGAFKHDPKRAEGRAAEPKPAEPLPTEPPPTLTELEATCWRDIRAHVHEGSVAFNDETAIEVASKLLCELRYNPGPMDIKTVNAFFKFLSLFGMTPADRSRVSVEKKAPAASPYGEFKAPAAR